MIDRLLALASTVDAYLNGYNLIFTHGKETADALRAAADEISRLHRRNAELTASELELATGLRIAESHRKMVCKLNEQQETQLEALRLSLASLEERETIRKQALEAIK